jgi:hypothetical protein
MPTICIDFDGVIHKYSKGWQDGSIYDELVDGAINFIKTLQDQNISVVILSTRKPEQIVQFLSSHIECQEVPQGTTFYNDTKVVGVTNIKLPAQVYIDDRAVTFNGNFSDIICQVINFKTWQQ